MTGHGMARASERRREPRSTSWLTLLLLIAAGLAAVLIPALLIQPFAPQTSRQVGVAYFLKRVSPFVTPAALLLSLALVWRLWRGGRWFGRVALCLLMVLPLVSAWFARQNHFEWMFHPPIAPAYAQAAEVDFLADSDMVLAVEQGGEAVAYPVRFLAYHHLVHDRLGEVPIVATY